jgi:hypothetical protein
MARLKVAETDAEFLDRMHEMSLSGNPLKASYGRVSKELQIRMRDVARDETNRDVSLDVIYQAFELLIIATYSTIFQAHGLTVTEEVIDALVESYKERLISAFRAGAEAKKHARA